MITIISFASFTHAASKSINRGHFISSSTAYSGIQLCLMVFVFINLVQKEEPALTGLIRFQPSSKRIMLFTSIQ